MKKIKRNNTTNTPPVAQDQAYLGSNRPVSKNDHILLRIYSQKKIYQMHLIRETTEEEIQKFLHSVIAAETRYYIYCPTCIILVYSDNSGTIFKIRNATEINQLTALLKDIIMNARRLGIESVLSAVLMDYKNRLITPSLIAVFVAFLVALYWSTSTSSRFLDTILVVVLVMARLFHDWLDVQ